MALIQDWKQGQDRPRNLSSALDATCDVSPKCNLKMFSYEFFYEVKQRKPSGEFLIDSQFFFRFLHTFELWRWQLFRSILTVITYFCVILLVVLVIAGYYKVDIDSKLAALLKTFLCLRSR